MFCRLRSSDLIACRTHWRSLGFWFDAMVTVKTLFKVRETGFRWLHARNPWSLIAFHHQYVQELWKLVLTILPFVSRIGNAARERRNWSSPLCTDAVLYDILIYFLKYSFPHSPKKKKEKEYSLKQPSTKVTKKLFSCRKPSSKGMILSHKIFPVDIL